MRSASALAGEAALPTQAVRDAQGHGEGRRGGGTAAPQSGHAEVTERLAIERRHFARSRPAGARAHQPFNGERLGHGAECHGSGGRAKSGAFGALMSKRRARRQTGGRTAGAGNASFRSIHKVSFGGIWRSPRPASKPGIAMTHP